MPVKTLAALFADAHKRRFDVVQFWARIGSAARSFPKPSCT
jgi:hypothetical protein